jgi:Protein of unknown function (DUF1997)
MNILSMDTCFKARQSVDMMIPPAAVPIEAYLRQSERIVQALANTGGVEALGGELFRLKLKPLKFFTLLLQPIVDMRVWVDGVDLLRVQSVGCEILGLGDFDQQHFDLNLSGEMYPLLVQGRMKLLGEVSLRVNVDMPMPIALTPKPILETTGSTIMLGVLSTMKQRLTKNLVTDYQDWANQERSALVGR